MSISVELEQFRILVAESVTNSTFIKATLGQYQGEETELKHIYVRRVLIKKQERMAFTYRYKTKDIVKNYSVEEALPLVSSYLESGFQSCTCFTTTQDIVLSFHPKRGPSLRMNKPSLPAQLPLQHDQEKARLISAAKPYLSALRITDKEGVVYKNAQDKYKQINQYVALLDPLIRALPQGSLKSVVDMGSGKGYLTFALYDYLVNILKAEQLTVTGVEYRPDLVSLCNTIAKESDFKGLNFVQGSIEDYPQDKIDLLIALHACDTATDDAIYKGITAGAELIVVAPCCHKQIRKEMDKNKVNNDLDFLTKYGIFMERQAVMVTDGIRALILEYFGYKTKVFEFISEANTPKNVLIVGSKIKGKVSAQAEILEKIKNTKEYFGIGYHHLEKLTGL